MSITTKPTRVLIVDDEPNIVIAIEFLMQQAGYQTEKAHDGLEAIHKAEHFNPDVIILDVMMPRMTGFEVAKEIRSRFDFQDVKIVFLTAKGTDKDKLEGYGSGGDVYLTKPFDNKELVQTVCEMVEFECH